MILLAAVAPLAAQTNPTPAAAATAEEAVTLSPFEVRAAKDSGYGATNAYTATRIGIPIIQTPINVQVVTEQLIKDQGVHDFQGALKFVSGVAGDSLNIDAGPLNIGAAGAFTIRGFVPTLFLRNGFRRPANLLSENVERIEVIKGPASVFFGQAAPGGLINVISRKPSSTPATSLDYTFGSYGFSKARLDATGPIGSTGVNYRVFASYEDSDDWRDFVYTKNLVIAPSFTWRPTDKLSLTFDYEHAHVKRNFPPYTAIGNKQFIADYENPPAAAQAFLNLTVTQLRNRWRNAVNTWINDRLGFSGVQPFRITDYIVDISPRGLKYNSGGPEQIYDHTTDSYTLESTFKLNSHVSFRYGGNYFKLDSFNLRSGLAVTNADKTINLAIESPRELDSWDIHQFDTLLTFDLPVVKNKIVLGYQYTRDRNIVRRAAFNTAAAPGGSATVLLHNAYTMPDILLSQIPYTLPDPASDSNLRNFTRGYAVSWFGEWFDSGRLTTLIGIRREQDYRERIGVPVLADLDRTATTPTYGATFRVADGVSLFASYSENFAPNSVRTRTGGGLLPSDNAADLPVELGKGKDLGIKTDWMNNRLSGSLSLYEVVRSSVPRADTAGEVADPRNVNGLTTPGSVRYNIAGGIERSRGVELDVVYAPVPHYQLLLSAGWMWEATVLADPSAVPGTIIYDRIFNQGRRLRNAPKYTFAAWNKYDFTTGPAKGLSLGLGVRYVSEVEPRATDSTTLLFNPAFTVVNALVSYKTRVGGQATTFSLNIDNLFDKLYYEGNTGVSDPRKIYLKTSVAF
jgi:outer membrane receptor protein involved in Fe transport